MVTQVMQEATEIPPISFQDYPVDIHLRIYREGARYGADIFSVGQVQRVPIEMSPQDLLALNKQLQEAVSEVAAENMEDWTPTSEELDELLSPLAEVGHYAFKQVFGHHDALAVIQELLSLGQPISIQVASEDFFLPWELLYPVRMDEPLAFQHFWGMNYITSRVIVQEARPGAFVSPIISVAQRPRLGLLTYCGLPSVTAKEIPFFEKLHGAGRIALFKLRNLDPAKKREEFKEFKGFWSNAFNLAHFACHAFYDDPPNLSRILLSDEFPISLQDLEVYGITINGHPLIVMNACETGNLNPLYTSYFAAAFLKYGARGVVATECAVPDAFAADFAQQLYTHLLAGEPLGESLLAARRYFLEKYHNPSGLLYSMYAPPSIRLAQVGE
jgi:hypothetical protein